ncbi:MAG: response regulator [Polaromonas sp.]
MAMRTYLVEDNLGLRSSLIGALEELAPVHAVGSADSQEEGAAWLSANASGWDLAIVDIFLKNGSGLKVLEACRARDAAQKVVVFSNYATDDMRVWCAERGVDAVFDKASGIEALLAYCVRQGARLQTAEPLLKNAGRTAPRLLS